MPLSVKILRLGTIMGRRAHLLVVLRGAESHRASALLLFREGFRKCKGRTKKTFSRSYSYTAPRCAPLRLPGKIAQSHRKFSSVGENKFELGESGY